MFHVKHEGLGSAAAAWGVPLDQDQLRRLEAYEALLASRGAELGLISRGDVPRLRERHVLDALRAAVAVEPPDRLAVDLGSGGGLPGIPVAIARPALRVVLAERRRSRAGFLELAVAELGLANVDVAAGPAGALDVRADLVFARAFADAPASWLAAEPLLGPRGRLVYFAGRRAADPGSIRGLRTRVLAPPVASAGALVIMTRQ
jgi:16S rRNA (guanine527-N7)-methyltransferase